MNDLRKAAEMALKQLHRDDWYLGHRSKTRADAITALQQALDDEPPVKTYCGGKPNYCTTEEKDNVGACVTCGAPKSEWLVDDINMTQDRVDETAKGEHDLWIAAACLKSTVEAAIKAGDWKVDGACDPTMDLQYLANCFSSIQNREWVGLTDDEVIECFDSVAFGQVEDDLIINKHVNIFRAIHSIEAKLREKNT